jgi:2-polyprenyl-6-methoxyphenol hydroxylase-like FAD-dependent oxidoreductase
MRGAFVGKVKKVLIIGGGIGGLSTAIALQKKGVQTEVWEKNSEWNVYGVGIIQASNQLRELGVLGVADECLAQGCEFPGWRFYNAAGDVLNEVPTPRADHYPANNGISRRDLHQILLDNAIKNGAIVKMGLTFSKIDNRENSVYVESTEGTSGEYDLLVGADGIRSLVRSEVFGKEYQPNFVGQGGWRYPMAKPEGLEWSGLVYGKKNKAVIVPMGPDSIYITAVSPESLNERMPEDQLHLMMQDRLKEFGGIVAELREKIVNPKEVVYRPYEEFLMPSPWYRGRVLLIGDAVHSSPPQLGQGAALAIEDAVVLADLVAQDYEIDKLLAEFMNQRIGRAKLVVETSVQLLEWEKLEWEGKLDPSINPSATFGQALKKMTEPILQKETLEN